MNLNINIVDPLGGLFTTPVNATINSIPFVDTFTGVVTDDSEVEIIVPSTSTNTGYSETIRVYTEDVNITIVLSTPVGINNANYLKPTPQFLAIRNPYTSSYDFYDTSTKVGKTYWYIDNFLVGEGNKYTHTFKSAGEHSVKIRTYVENEACVPIWDIYLGSIQVGNTTIGDLQSSTTYLALDTSTNFVVANVLPEITITTSSPSQLYVDNTCFAIGDNVSFITDVNTNTLGTWALTVNVLSPSGEEIFVESFTGQTQADLDTISTSPDSFPIATQGEYKINVELFNEVSQQFYYYTYKVYGGNVISIEYVTCNTYKITNLSTQLPAVELEIINHATGKVLDDTTYSLVANVPQEITFDEGIGVYRLRAFINTSLIQREWYSIVNTFCEIEACITDYITSLLCEGCDTSKNVDSYLYDYMKFHTLIHVYHSKLQEEFGFNNVYTGFDIAKLNSLTEIQDIIDALSGICSCSSWAITEDTGCTPSDSSTPSSLKTGGCGCGCGNC